MTTPLTDEQIEAQRATFEAWAKEYGRIFLKRDGEGYQFPYTQECWVAWKGCARALLAQPSVAPPAPGGDVLERRSETGMPMSANAPEKCPITRRPFFMVISHPELGWVPTYGGPYDSYTIPHMEGKPNEPYHERELTCHHYDHDYGGWVDDESIPMRVINEGVLNALQSTQAPTALQVWYGSTPESNGRTNWTAILHRGDLSEGFTLARSEHPQRVRYGADCVRHLIGELPDEPDVLAYDGDELTPCHLCGGSGIKDGKPCWGLNFEGTVHNAPTAQGQDAAPAEQTQTGAVRDVLAERQRQIEKEGWTPGHDDHHRDNSLAKAASCYAWAACGLGPDYPPLPPVLWPWASAWWKPKDQRTNLVRAGALILAEIERIDRAARAKE